MASVILEGAIKQGVEYSGLSSIKAKERLLAHGANARPTKPPKTFWHRIGSIILEPMMGLLFITSILYFFLGSLAEACIIFGSIVPIIIIEYMQEKRVDRAVAALAVMHVEMCKVYRDGRVFELPSSDLVPGDLIYLTAGDKVPADLVILFTPGILVDESLLTGEAAPVVKQMVDANDDGASEACRLWQGTMIVQGEARALVAATGAGTRYSEIGALMEGIKLEATPLQKKIEHLVSRIAIVAIAVAVLVGVILGVEFGLIHGLLAALTIAIAIIPEEFPIVFSVFLIMGVWRLSKRHALVREMALVETLGSATVICSDKTGTLTEGVMSLTHFYYENKLYTVGSKDAATMSSCQSLIRDALLAVERVAVDPIEIEVQRVAAVCGVNVEKYFNERALMQDSSFNSNTKTVQHSWRDASGAVRQYVAGAPEQVIGSSNLSESAQKQAMQAYTHLAGEGFRVIAVATHDTDSNGTLHTSGWKFCGLLAMMDPPRAGVVEAIKRCYEAGIRVVMITGDNELTARFLAASIGIKLDNTFLSGADLEKLSGDELRKAVGSASIYYRVKPEQKFLIVQALLDNGEVVAMTGDGVNDAPALKRATIGVAMGKRGTEVARAAAGMVLLDDNFSTIVNAMEEGRRIYDNLRHAFVFLFSLHLPIVGMAVVPLFLHQDLFFFPIQIIFLELFGDPAAVLGFERDSLRPGAMREPPRPRNEPLLSRRLWGTIGLYGLMIFAVTFGYYYYYTFILNEIEVGRTMAFIALVFAQIMLVVFSRDWAQVKRNPVLLGIAAATLTFLEVVVFVKPIQHLFHFVPITIAQNVEAAGLAIFVVFIASRLGRKM